MRVICWARVIPCFCASICCTHQISPSLLVDERECISLWDKHITYRCWPYISFNQNFLRIFKVADVDGSGALSKEEVGKYLCRQEQQSPAMLALSNALSSVQSGNRSRRDIVIERAPPAKRWTVWSNRGCESNMVKASLWRKEVSDKLTSLKLFVPDWKLGLHIASCSVETEASSLDCMCCMP